MIFSSAHVTSGNVVFAGLYQQLFNSDRKMPDSHAGCVIDGVRNGWSNPGDRDFTQSPGANGTDVEVFDIEKEDVDVRDVRIDRKQIVCKAVRDDRAASLVVHGLLHQSHADALDDPAVRLAARGFGIDDAANIESADDVDHLNRSEVRIDANLDEMRTKRMEGVLLQFLTRLNKTLAFNRLDVCRTHHILEGNIDLLIAGSQPARFSHDVLVWHAVKRRILIFDGALNQFRCGVLAS